MDIAQHPAAPHHLPAFITAPGQTDVLFVVVLVFLVLAVLAVGVFYFWLHSLPERMVHNKLQYDLVAVLALLSLFTHNHAFWIAGLLLAFIDLPQFHLPHVGRSFQRIADSLEKISDDGVPPAPDLPSATDAPPSAAMPSDPAAAKHGS